jgi:hypothetical protein
MDMANKDMADGVNIPNLLQFLISISPSINEMGQAQPVSTHVEWTTERLTARATLLEEDEIDLQCIGRMIRTYCSLGRRNFTFFAGLANIM